MENNLIPHLQRLAKDNAQLRIEIRNARLENTRLKDEVSHLQRELARQNARIIELQILKEVNNDRTGTEGSS